MPLRLYADVHIPHPAVRALVTRGVDIITAQQDSADGLADNELLSRAAALNRVVVTQDQDFQGIAARWLREQRNFAGIIYISAAHTALATVVDDLALCAEALDPEDMLNHVEHLPL